MRADFAGKCRRSVPMARLDSADMASMVARETGCIANQVTVEEAQECGR